MDNATHHFSPLARGMIHPQPTYLQSLPQIQDAMPPATEALDIIGLGRIVMMMMNAVVVQEKKQTTNKRNPFI